MKTIFFKVIFIFSLLVPALSLGAETFRVRAVVSVPLADLTAETKARAGINDALLITLPDDMTYVSGIELHFKIPEVVAAWRDTIAYSLYDDLVPAPTPQTIDYTGNRISVGTFPGRLSHTIYIPLSEQMELKDSPYHEKIAVIPDTKEKAVFFRMQLAMKGVPEAFEDAMFDLSAKPVLINKGMLVLSVAEPQSESEAYAVFIDDAPFTPRKAGNLLTTGEHHLSITSDAYRNEVRTFRIEQAKTTNLAVTLRGIEPLVRIVSPENAQVYFDGELLENTKDAFKTTPGDHTVRFVIGDYEVSRTVSAINGRSYTVNLSVDAAITEEED